jgi:hypothetical protein
MGWEVFQEQRSIVQFIPFAVGGVFLAAFWNNRIYFGGSGDNLTVFKFDPGEKACRSPQFPFASAFGFQEPAPPYTRTAVPTAGS